MTIREIITNVTGFDVLPRPVKERDQVITRKRIGQIARGTMAVVLATRQTGFSGQFDYEIGVLDNVTGREIVSRATVKPNQIKLV